MEHVEYNTIDFVSHIASYDPVLFILLEWA